MSILPELQFLSACLAILNSGFGLLEKARSVLHSRRKQRNSALSCATLTCELVQNIGQTTRDK